MYILNIAKAIKKMSVNDISETLPLITIISELDFLKKTGIIQ